jgi:hypothetical protein
LYPDEQKYFQKKRKMDPQVWGPHAWTFLHLSALHADRSGGRKEWKSLMGSFVMNLPCNECKKHAQAYWSSYEYQEDSSAFEWTLAFHNKVNVRLGKKELSLEKALKIWDHEHCNLQCSDAPSFTEKSNSNVLIVCIIVGLLLFCYGALRWRHTFK